MIKIFALTFCILFIIYFSFGIIIHLTSALKPSKKGLIYMIVFFYSRSILFLGPAFLLFTDNIIWSFYSSGPIKVLIIPILYFYFSKLNSIDKKIRKSDWLHFVPFLFEIAFTLPIVYVHSSDIYIPGQIKLVNILDIQWDNHFYYNLLAITARSIALVQAIVYAFLISRTYRVYKQSFLNQKSLISFSNLSWIKWVSYILIANGFISGFELFGLFAKPIFFILAAFFLLFTAFFLLIYSILNDDLHHKQALNTENHTDKITEDILRKFKEMNLYLKPDLSLQEAAFQLQIAKYKFTESIKQGGYDNFYHFVNQLRVDKSKELLQNISHQYSIDSIVSESGFNSRSTFYRVFKEYSGMTPTEYIKNSKE